jgi:histidinol-phosphate aminotransferase
MKAKTRSAQDHGGEGWQLEVNKPGDYSKIIAADVNDVFYPPAPNVVRAIAAWASRSNYSPDASCRRLKSILSVYHGIPDELLYVGSGSSGLLHECIRSIVRPADEVLILDPTYSEYARSSKSVGALITKAKPDAESGFVVEPALLYKGLTTKTRLVILCNPNNPTGRIMRRDDIKAVLKELPRGTFLLIDETYVDFAIEESLLPDVVHWPNLIVTRTFSKVYGLAGLRIGYAAMGEKAARLFVKTVRPPWQAGTLALRAAEAALENREYVDKMIAKTLRLKKDFARQIAAIDGALITPSETHFFLVGLRKVGMQSDVLCAILEARHVFIRDCRGFGSSLQDGYVRVTTQDSTRNQCVVTSIAEALREFAL